MKQTITLPKKTKRKLTRTQTILRNILAIVLMISAILFLRKGTFTEQQAYQRQLQSLGIPETAIESGSVQIIEDRQLNSAAEMDPSMHGPDVDFEPTRQVILESTAGGEKAQLIIVVGKRSFLWYDAAWNLSYPAYP
ncbi:MAG: hypothetical protein ACI4LJ_09740 [Anaerovoracaceae bacterium]